MFEVIAPRFAARIAVRSDLESTYARGEAWLGYMWARPSDGHTRPLPAGGATSGPRNAWNSHQGCALPEFERGPDQPCRPPSLSRNSSDLRSSSSCKRLGLLRRRAGAFRDLDVRQQRDAGRSGDLADLSHNNPRVWASSFVTRCMSPRACSNALGLSASDAGQGDDRLQRPELDLLRDPGAGRRLHRRARLRLPGRTASPVIPSRCSRA